MNKYLILLLVSLVISSLSSTTKAEDECFPGEMFEYNKMLFYLAPGSDYCTMIDFFYIEQEGALSKYNSQWGNYTDKEERLKWLDIIDYSGDVEIPSVVEYNGTYYPVKHICCWTTGAFGTAKTTSITVPGSVYSIAGLSGMANNIEKIIFREGFNYITGIERLTVKEVELPSTITFIAPQSFREVKGLEEFSFPRRITSIGSQIVYNCPDLKVLKMNNVRKVSSYVGSKLPKLTTLDLGLLTEIERDSFNELSSLEDLTIPETMQKIGPNCFSDMPKLKKLTLPSHPIEVDHSFNYLETREIYARSREPYDLNGSFYGCRKGLITVYVPKGAKEAYMAHPDWAALGDIIEDAASVDEITADSFEVRGTDGELEITLSSAAEVVIYAADGKVAAKKVIDGTEIINLAPGLYIAKCGQQSKKVIVK